MRSFGLSAGVAPVNLRLSSRRLSVILLMGSSLVLAGTVLAENPARPKLSAKTRQEILHSFNAELVYIRTTFPMGKTGLRLKNGTITPNGAELQQLVAIWGPAVKAGDRARISDVFIKENHIRFEINGGPMKRGKWYQHIQIEGTASTTVTPGGGDSSMNARGSYVDLYFDKYVPELTGPELKELLYPVFDFDSRTALEAYLLTVPPKVRDAIMAHQVLVGMNQEMVIYSKGRPPRRVREKDGGTDYEEWIYGAPPQDVDFVRFVGDEVVRVETMSVDGKKVVRVEKEVDVSEPTVAKKGTRPAPTLRRPGEEMPDANPSQPSSLPPAGAPPPGGPPGTDPGPNWNPGQFSTAG
jgi:hypothetical protein